MTIPVNRPLFHGNEDKYLTDCIKTGWVSSEGPFVRELEETLAGKTGRQFGIAVSSGSAALDIAVAAIGIDVGDEVIMPTFSIISPAFSIVRAGGIPVLIDSDPGTWNMNVQDIERKITNKTKAIIVVHTYGLPVDLDPVLSLCKKYNLRLIEDAAEMHGQTYYGKPCGSFGDISVFSFYPNKLITTGEGGMVLTDDPELVEKCRKLKNLGFEDTGRRFVHKEMGWNYRMTNIQAALGLAQLEFWDEHINRKKEIGRRYREGLSKLAGCRLQVAGCSYAENIYWVFGIVADSEDQCSRMTAYLHSKGIATRPFFWCMHEQPVFIDRGLFKDEHYPVAEKLARNGFYIPSGTGTSNAEVETVIEILNAFE
ncbi:MAG TPA: DegT/DnrJ/EryC1/StrS family aminotransferase [Chitinophagaceae bacterium]|nr:DegT/DnrJ/EryC1/StrS family aminotransferase [Chitinophagaceae bacterium]